MQYADSAREGRDNQVYDDNDVRQVSIVIACFSMHKQLIHNSGLIGGWLHSDRHRLQSCFVNH